MVIVLTFLLAIVFSLLLALIEAVFIKLVMPYTGIPYDPTYWQAFFLAGLLNIMFGFAYALASTNKE